MSEIVVLLGKLCGCVVAGILAGHGAVYVFNKIPAAWLRVKGRKPEESLEDKYTQRVKGYPYKMVFSAIFVVGLFRLVLFDWIFAAAALAACWALLQIAMASSKYCAIPDPFVILLGISAMGLISMHKSPFQMALGILLGGGLILLIVLIGKWVFRSSAVGFGEVKLCAVLGLALGVRGIASALILAFFLYSAAFAVRKLRRLKPATEMAPLGPYICAAAMVYLVIIWPLLDQMPFQNIV